MVATSFRFRSKRANTVSSEFLISGFVHLQLTRCIFMYSNGLLRISSNGCYVQ